MPTLQINPLDSLFFRDGKPFSMGDDVWANGIFPPSPLTIYGALRSSYFSNNIQILEQANVDGIDPSINLQIKKIIYRDNDSYIIPIPLDLVSIKGEIPARLLSLEKKEHTISSSLFNENLSYQGSGAVKSLEGNYLSLTHLESYLNNQANKFPFINSETLFIQEPKIGIARNIISKTSDEGKIYRVAMVRSKDRDFVIAVEYENLELNKSGNFKLGADGRLVHYDTITNIEIQAPQTINKRFKLYLLTPAIFKSGWLPFGLNSNQLEIKYQGVNLKLLTCVVGKYINIGGFQFKNKNGISNPSPKSMYRVVPAGSVYYFESDCEDPQKIIKLFHNQSISDENKKEGFGIALVGKI